jgi:hypothetical protein
VTLRQFLGCSHPERIADQQTNFKTTRSRTMKALRGSLKSGALVLGLWCASILPASALPVLSLSATQAGSVMSIAVSATGATDLYGYQFSLNFDPAVLHASTVSEGPFLATAGTTFFDNGTTDNSAGQVSFVFDTLISAIKGATGSGVLAVVSFNIQNFHTFTTLSLSDVLALDSNLNVLPTTTQSLRLQIPEPSMLALLAIALLGMALIVGRNPQR